MSPLTNYAPFVIYADLESLIKKNSEKLSTTKVDEHLPCRYSMSMIWAFYMKKFFKSLREHTMKIINFEKKIILLLTNKQQKLYEKTKICYIYQKKFVYKYTNEKNHIVKDHCHYTGKYRGATHSLCNLKFSTPEEIPLVFHNGLNYDYCFIIKS